MKTILTCALLGSALTLSACGGTSEEAVDTGVEETAFPETLPADPATMAPPMDAGTGMATDAATGMATGAATGGAMEPGAGMDPGGAADVATGAPR